MKLKVLFVGDNHISAKNPVNRKDNYLEATLNKLKDCLQIGLENNVDAIVFLGDMFDVREEGPLARNGALNILRSQSDNTPWPFPLYIVVGNHDIGSSFPLDKSSLGTLIEANALTKVDFVDSLGIAFAHFTPFLDNEIKNNDFLLSQEAVIWACHASICDVPNPHYADKLVVFSEIKTHPKTKMIISGHIHHPMYQVREDGVIFVNPGAIGRYSASKDNLTRTLKVFLLEYDLQGNIYSQEYLDLPSAKSFEEVFKIDEIKEAKLQKLEVREYIKKVSQITTNSWATTVLDDKIQSLKDMGKNDNIEDIVVEMAIEALRKANEDPNLERNEI